MVKKILLAVLLLVSVYAATEQNFKATISVTFDGKKTNTEANQIKDKIVEDVEQALNLIGDGNCVSETTFNDSGNENCVLVCTTSQSTKDEKEVQDIIFTAVSKVGGVKEFKEENVKVVKFEDFKATISVTFEGKKNKEQAEHIQKTITDVVNPLNKDAEEFVLVDYTKTFAATDNEKDEVKYSISKSLRDEKDLKKAIDTALDTENFRKMFKADVKVVKVEPPKETTFTAKVNIKFDKKDKKDANTLQTAIVTAVKGVKQEPETFEAKEAEFNESDNIAATIDFTITKSIRSADNLKKAIVDAVKTKSDQLKDFKDDDVVVEERAEIDVTATLKYSFNDKVAKDAAEKIRDAIVKKVDGLKLGDKTADNTADAKFADNTEKDAEQKLVFTITKTQKTTEEVKTAIFKALKDLHNEQKQLNEIKEEQITVEKNGGTSGGSSGGLSTGVLILIIGAGVVILAVIVYCFVCKE